MQTDKAPQKPNEAKARRGAPVKLIWLLVTIVLCVGGTAALAVFVPVRSVGTHLQNVFYSIPLYLLLAVGAGLSMARGCINLSLPGTMSVSMMTFGLAYRGGMATLPAMLLALLSGAAYGTLNGIFALQRRRNIQLVTALSSLLIGMAGTGFAAMISNLRNISLDIENKAYMTAGTVFVLIALGVCFFGAVGGKKLFRMETDEEPGVSGRNRFLWSVIAGMLAALAGIFLAIRNQRLHINIGSDSTYQVILFFILVTAGILIPNVRRTYTEALFGLLAIPFAAFAFGTVDALCAYLRLETAVTYIIYAVAGLLLLIPNLLVCRRKKEDLAVKEN